MKHFSSPLSRRWLVLVTMLYVSFNFHRPASAFTNGMQDLLQRLVAAPPRQDLPSLSEYFTDTVLDIRLDITEQKKQAGGVGASNGQSKQRQQTPSMAIQNLVLQLQRPDNNRNKNDADSKATQGSAAAPVVLPMPGFHGPHPHTSAGVGRAAILAPGHFIDRTGRVDVQIAPATASWELVWRPNAHAGSLICGLEIVDDAVRNGARLPKGRLYLSFSVWSPTKLAEYQIQKANCAEAGRGHLADRDAELAKMQATSNILQKAVHYRNAFAAVEKYSLQPHSVMRQVPLADGVLPLAGGALLLGQAGRVWTVGAGGFLLPTRVVLGTASIKIPVPGPSPPPLLVVRDDSLDASLAP